MTLLGQDVGVDKHSGGLESCSLVGHPEGHRLMPSLLLSENIIKNFYKRPKQYTTYFF